MNERLDGCPEFDARLVDSVFGSTADGALDRHLSSCARCRAARERYLRTADVLGEALAGEPEPAAPRTAPLVRRARRRAAVVAGLAAAAALLFAAWYAFPASTPELAGEVASARTERLLEGGGPFEAAGEPLIVLTPAGRLETADARFRVDVDRREEIDMHGRRVVTVVAVAVTAGVVWWAAPDGELRVGAGQRVEREVDAAAQATRPVVLETPDGDEARLAAVAPPQVAAPPAAPREDWTWLYVGRAVDPAGEGVADATLAIEFTVGTEEESSRLEPTGADGRFRVPLPPPEIERVELSIRHPDRGRWRLDDATFERDRARRAQLEGPIDLGDVVLESAGSLTVRVLDAEGTFGVGGARLVMLQGASEFKTLALPGADVPLGATDAYGRCASNRVLDLLDTGRGGAVTVVAFSPAGSGWVVIPADARAGDEVTLRLRRAAALGVTVVDGERSPCAGVTVLALPRELPFFATAFSNGAPWVPDESPEQAPFRGTTDAEGRVVFEELPLPEDGGLELEVRALRPETEESASRVVQLGADAAEPVVLQLARAHRGPLLGLVVDESGAAVASATVIVHPGGATTSEGDGGFTFPDRPEGTRALRVIVRAPGFMEEDLDVDLTSGPRAEPVRVVLRPGLSILGRVVDAEGHGIAGANLAATAAGESLANSHANSEEDGSFAFHGLSPGAWSLAVEGVDVRGRQEFLGRSGFVAQAGREDVELVLERAPEERGHVRLEIVDSDSGVVLEPDQLMLIPIERAGALPGRSTRALWSGGRRRQRSEVRDLLPGPYELWVAVAGKANHHEAVEVLRGEQTLRVTVGAPARVEGTVVVEEGATAPERIWVLIRQDSDARSAPGGAGWERGGDGFSSTELAEDGRFAFEGLATGRCRVSLWPEELETEVALELRPGAAEHVELRVRP